MSRSLLASLFISSLLTIAAPPTLANAQAARTGFYCALITPANYYRCCVILSSSKRTGYPVLSDETIGNCARLFEDKIKTVAATTTTTPASTPAPTPVVVTPSVPYDCCEIKQKAEYFLKHRKRAYNKLKDAKREYHRIKKNNESTQSVINNAHYALLDAKTKFESLNSKAPKIAAKLKESSKLAKKEQIKYKKIARTIKKEIRKIRRKLHGPRSARQGTNGRQASRKEKNGKAGRKNRNRKEGQRANKKEEKGDRHKRS
jgi:hypothetical protein